MKEIETVKDVENVKGLKLYTEITKFFFEKKIGSGMFCIL